MTRGLQVLLCAVLLVLTGSLALAHCRPENRVWGFSEQSAAFASYEAPKPIDTPSESPGCGYDFASGVHKYLYCQGNPILGIDPSGRDDDLVDVLMTSAMQSTLFSLVSPAVRRRNIFSVKWLSI